MYHLVLILLVAVLSILGWMLVMSAPRALSLVLPRTFSFYAGAFIFTFATFMAYMAAFALGSPAQMLGCFVTVFVGIFFMFAATAALRGSEADNELVRRVAAMVALLLAVIVASLYVPDPRMMALLNLGLVGAGFAVTRSYLRRLGG